MPVEPDPDATPVDHGLMTLANNLEHSGWTEEADELRSHAAQLRETWRGMSGADPTALYEALENIHYAAEGAKQIIEKTTPPPMPRSCDRCGKALLWPDVGQIVLRLPGEPGELVCRECVNSTPK